MSNDATRFWSKVDRSTACWLWCGAVQSGGYGSFWLDGKMQLAHRVAYGWIIAPVPDILTVDHLCKRRTCVNPAHMEIVTLKENVLRSGSPPALNARKECCPAGHPYIAENTLLHKGERICRACRTIRSRANTLAKGGKVRSIKPNEANPIIRAMLLPNYVPVMFLATRPSPDHSVKGGGYG